MTYKSIIRLFEERKQKLEGLLEIENLATEQYSRVVGAIDELNIMLRTLQLREQEESRFLSIDRNLNSRFKGVV